MLAVVVDHRSRIFVVLVQAVAHYLRRVVGASFGGGAAGDAFHQHFGGYFQLHAVIHRLADFLQQATQGVGLDQVARVAIQDESVGGIRARQAVFQHAQQDLVADKIAAGHHFLGLHAQGAAGGHFGAQQVAGGDVRNLQVLLEARGLRALARPGRAQ